jgi:hypothetical protein
LSLLYKSVTIRFKAEHATWHKTFPLAAQFYSYLVAFSYMVEKEDYFHAAMLELR